MIDRLLWGAYVVVVALALAFPGADHPFVARGALPAGKYVVWTVWAAFLGYSLACSKKEDLFATIRVLNGLWWGRQIGMDLYLGLTLFVSMIALHEGWTVGLLWLAPTLVYGNLAPLLYVAVHYDSLVARFGGA
jgi:hypothetical protein